MHTVPPNVAARFFMFAMPSPFGRCPLCKADTIIANLQHHHAVTHGRLDENILCLCMLQNIVQGFFLHQQQCSLRLGVEDSSSGTV